MTNPEVDADVATSNRWPAEIAAVRPILVGAALTEEFTWRRPDLDR